MIIDAHVHIGQWMRPYSKNGNAVDELIQSARLNNIDRLCVSSLGDRGYTSYPNIDEFTSANTHILELMQAFPQEIMGFCYVNPRHSNASLAELDRCITDGGMVGIKLWVACKTSDSLVDPIVEKAIELGVPILQHAWYKTTGNLPDESTPADIAELARRFPDVTIIMAHLHGAGYRGILDIAPYPNILVDTSGGDPESTVVEFAVRELGGERIVFGSDTPGRSFGVQIGKVLGANLPHEVKRLILCGNMERILKSR
ncbi:TPA: amidohydrolase [Candidatus Poribacteria bacterium]|nr:amidohydrolase [Candidatus Poribacteria bacterium]